MYKAKITITLRPSILDPQGKAVLHALESLGYAAAEQVRMGKFVELWINEETEEGALRIAREACEKLLANPVMEDYAIVLEKGEKAVTS
jgi:phosphoribosylformylglycinamidine synthase